MNYGSQIVNLVVEQRTQISGLVSFSDFVSSALKLLKGVGLWNISENQKTRQHGDISFDIARESHQAKCIS